MRSITVELDIDCHSSLNEQDESARLDGVHKCAHELAIRLGNKLGINLISKNDYDLIHGYMDVSHGVPHICKVFIYDEDTIFKSSNHRCVPAPQINSEEIVSELSKTSKNLERYKDVVLLTESQSAKKVNSESAKTKLKSLGLTEEEAVSIFKG